MKFVRSTTALRVNRLGLQLAPVLLAMCVAWPAHAQYKVVGPDGKITYTDRAPTASQGKATPIAGRIAGAAAAGDAALPLELRQSVARYPVTLYVMSTGCDPCESARQLLKQRGIPYNEKQVQSAEDSEALERISGGRDAPTLSIGSQTLRGLAPDVWNSYLDAAGYPRESRLAANYRYPAPTPLTEKREAPAAREAAARASAPIATPPAPPAPPPAPEPAPGGIKF